MYFTLKIQFFWGVIPLVSSFQTTKYQQNTVKGILIGTWLRWGEIGTNRAGLRCPGSHDHIPSWCLGPMPEMPCLRASKMEVINEPEPPTWFFNISSFFSLFFFGVMSHLKGFSHEHILRITTIQLHDFWGSIHALIWVAVLLVLVQMTFALLLSQAGETAETCRMCWWRKDQKYQKFWGSLLG